MSNLDVYSFPSPGLDPDVEQRFEKLLLHLTSARAGRPWCQWVQKAIRKETFWVSDARDLCNHEGFDETITRTIERFRSRSKPPSNTGDNLEKTPHLLDSLTVLLPSDVDYNESERMVHQKRPEMLSMGLMLALLHPEADQQALTPGPDGCPYQTASPFLTVRWAIPGDEVFTDVNSHLNELLDRWLQSKGWINESG